MPLSRLENFLKNAEGNILYVNPSDFDATDSLENRGNSLTRPFKTIQRALIEAARFSYQTGKNNDRIDRTTILTFPGTHYIDNRPGYTVQETGGVAVYKARRNSSYISQTLQEFTTETNFDILDRNNELYKYNSVEGGVILPRGTSIIGLDLRKTKIRPLYVPDPEDSRFEYTSIFRVTGTCYFTAFTIFDGDISKTCYYDFDSNVRRPTFSHHKLSCFQYADGVNNIIIDGADSQLTDLDMYYYKIAKAYGDASGRAIGDFPTFDDFEPNVDEFRIVGDLSADPIGITSIRAGDGNTSSTVITVDTLRNHGLFKDTPILIAGITTSIQSYNGSFLVSEVITDRQFRFVAPSAPGNPLPIPQEFQNSSVIIEPDTVSSASPYVFNCSLRSVYGMNGMDCNGDKATGFKSMVVAQFTGISIQKDDNAFVIYNPDTAVFNDTNTVSDAEKPLHSNSKAIYKPRYETSHMRIRNNAVVQIVSVFAIAFARHFHAERGGDASITNSNSNFGQTALESEGFRPQSFDRDNTGYITHIIPPRELVEEETTVSWLTIDVAKTVGTANTSRLYLYGYDTLEISPPSQIDSYRVGGKKGERLYLSLVNTLSGTAQQATYEAPVLMQVTSGVGTSRSKEYDVIRSSGVNYVISNVFGLVQNHQLVNGEKVRIFSDTGETPNGIVNDKIYYAITGGTLANNRMQLAATFNDAIARRPITGLSNAGGKLKIVSTVADKVPGEPGHPIQWDDVVLNWYILVNPSFSVNTIYPNLVALGAGVIGEESGSTYITRRVDNRSLLDRVYRVRYVIPKEHIDARPPTPGFVLQESKTTGISSASFLSANLSNPTQLKNVKLIKNATYSSGSIIFTTEKNHGLEENDLVTVTNVQSSNNSTAKFGFGYNGENVVTQVLSAKQFRVAGITTDPGTFQNQINQRTTQQQIDVLPTIQKSKSVDSLYVYRVNEIRGHRPGISGQDGIYNVTLACGSIALDKDLGFGVSFKAFSQDVRNLYPQQDRDNYDSDPQPTVSFASPEIVGKVVTNDRKRSLTRESLNIFMQGFNVGTAVTGAVITGTGNTTITLFSTVEHKFNSIKKLNVINPGAGYNNASGIATVIYDAELVNNALPGRNASVKVTVSAAGTITDISLNDGGSAYGIGNTMTISAYPAGNPTTFAVVQVSDIFDNVGDGLDLNGFANDAYNGTFKIVEVPTSKSVSVELGTYRSAGDVYIPRTDRRFPQYSAANPGVAITSIEVLDRSKGIARVRVKGNHTLVAGNTLTIWGTGNRLFDERTFVVDDVEPNAPLTGLHINVGIITAGVSTAYSITNSRLFGYGVRSKSRALGQGENNLGARGSVIWTGISTTLAAPISATDTTISLTDTAGFRRGDYLQINAEIVRIANDNINTVLRGQFGTVSIPAISGTTVKKVDIIPIELRRPSILRASGHTFEYLGYGSGNYSTSLPQKQNRVLGSEEQLTAQKKELSGGKVVYTGMNDSGEFYTGYNKLSAITGEEEIIGAPIFTYTGDDAETETTRKLSGVFDELLVREGITVEGGDNNNRTSQFYGPVNFTKKLTNNSEEGIETINLYLKGSAPQGKLLTVGISTPAVTKRSGDTSFVSTPLAGGYLGWIFSEGEWRRFGVVSQERDRNFIKLDQLGIGRSNSAFNFTDALEVNGTVKLKDLYVSGIVTFASNQSFSGVTYDTIIVKKVANFWGYNTTGGISAEGIPWENYNRYTQVHEAGVSQLYDLETVGTYVTFKPSSKLRIEGPIFDSFAGVSTFVGTLDVGNLECDGGSVNVTFLNALQAGISTLAVNNTLSARVGVITDLHSTVGVFTNGLFANVGIVTNLFSTTTRVDTLYAFNGITTNVVALNNVTTPVVYSNVGVLTNISGTNLNYSNITGVAVTATRLNFTDQFFGPTAFVNTGIITSVQARYIGGLGNAGPGQPSLQMNVNSGVVTSLVGYAITYQELQLTSGGRASIPILYANTGIITNLGDGTTNQTVRLGPTGKIFAFQFESTTTNSAPPIVTNSTAKVINLNADLLDGLDTSSTDTSGNSVVTRTSGNFSGNIISANSFAGGNGTFTQLTCNGGMTVTGTLNASGGITGSISGNISGNAATATLANNVRGNGGSVLYQSGQDQTTTSGSFTFNGSQLSVGGDIVAFASDIRLKTNIEPIEDAISRIRKLSGFTYNLNDRAENELGLTSEERLVGLSAQEVLAVLPEAVKPAPANPEYLTVQYEKLVPLLIEAIKEQQNQIDKLTAMVENLTNK